MNIIENYEVAGGREVLLTPSDMGDGFDMMLVSWKSGLMAASVRVNVSEALKHRASWIASIVRDIFTKIFASSQAELTVEAIKWQVLSLESIRVGCYAHLISILTDSKEGLSRDRMNLVADITRKAAVFLFNFCESPQAFSQKNKFEVRQPVYSLIENVLQILFPDDEELALQLKGLFQGGVDACVSEFLTPAVVTKILLSIEFPYGEGDDEDAGTEEILKLTSDFPEECNGLGDAIIEAVDILLTKGRNLEISQKKGIFKLAPFIGKVGGIVGTGILKRFKKYIGAYVFATINAALRSETSVVLKIIESTVKKIGTEDEGLEEESLRERLDLTIKNDLARVIKLVIDEEEGKSETMKQWAVDTIKLISPILVEIVWDKKSRPIEQLICHYLPLAVIPYLPEVESNQMRPRSSNEPGSVRFQTIALRFVQDYLLPEDDQISQWRALFLCMVKVGVRKMLAEPKETPLGFATHENILRLGYVVTGVNRFLNCAIENNHSFEIEDDELNRPLAELLYAVAEIKYPGNVEIHSEIVGMGIKMFHASFDKLLNPIFISNLILKMELKGITLADASVGEEVAEDYEVVGHEIVRLLRTIMRLGDEKDELGWFNKLIAAGARRYRSTIGSRLAEAVNQAAKSNSDTVIDLIEKALWIENSRHDSEPILFEGWITGKKKLQEELNGWIDKQLLPFIFETIAQQGYGRTINKLIEGHLRPAIPLIARKFFNLIWHKDNTALRFLVIHHLLPIFRREIILKMK